MACTFTNNVTLDADTVAEYNDLMQKVNEYAPGPGDPTMSNLVEDQQNLRITYTLTATE